MVPAASLFNQLLQHFPRTEFAVLVRKHQAERGAKGCKRLVNLSITHNSRGVESELNIGGPGKSAPHDKIAGGGSSAQAR